MARRTHAVTTAATLAGVLVLTGCSSGDDGDPSPGEELRDSALIPGAYANPLDPVMFPDEPRHSLISAALERSVTGCMAASGLTYQTGDAFPQRRTAQDAQYAYSVTDPEVAAQFGFHPASWVEEIRAADGQGGTRPDGYAAALFGQSDRVRVTDEDGTVIATYDPDSCVGRARDAITPGWAQQDRIFHVSADILLAVADDVVQDEEMREANADWAACMAEAGYHYGSPLEANDDERFSTDLPTAEEIPVAVASATCQHSSGLLRTWSRVRAELTQVELDAHPGIVTQWLELQDQAATVASGS